MVWYHISIFQLLNILNVSVFDINTVIHEKPPKFAFQFIKTKDKKSLKHECSKCIKYDGEIKVKLMVVGEHINAIKFLHISYIYLIHIKRSNIESYYYRRGKDALK